MARHFVTGGAGFLGSSIVRALYDKGEKDIVVHDILEVKDKLPGVRYVVGDILNIRQLEEATRGVTYIYHCAALVPLTKSGKHFRDVNVLGTRNIVSCARMHKVEKLVHISSSAIYGVPKEIPITEKTPYAPVEIYGQSKLDAEKEVWKYMQEGGHASCLRPRTIIGGASRLGIFQILFEWISENVPVYVMGKGDNLFQFIHVDDFIDAALKAATSPHDGLYNIGCEEYTTLRGDLETFIKEVGSTSKVRSIPIGLTRFILHVADIFHLSPLAPWHYLTYQEPFVFDITKEKRELDWQPRYGNVPSLVDSYKWYTTHRSEIRGGSSASAHTKPVRQGILKIVKWFSKVF